MRHSGLHRGLSVAAGAVALAGSLWALGGTAGATSGPPLPAGTRSAAVTPYAYPGGGAAPFGNAGATPIPPLPAGLTLNSVAMRMALTNDGQGYWIAAADGGVFTAGDAHYFGSLGSLTLNGPVVGFTPTADSGGYWMVALDGGVFAFGDAKFYGSMGGQPLNDPIVGMASTHDGKGYWLVAADGGLFAYGDAQYYGSMGGTPLDSPISGIAVTPDGKGYWLAAGDGGIFTFGDAGFFGSMGGQPLNDGISAMAPTKDGQGYWLLGWDGGIFTFGDARYFGSAESPSGAETPYNQILPTPDNGGYWLFSPDELNYSFANPPPNGSYPGSASIVAAAESQVQPDPLTGYFCNPYGPCESWCALFATWALQQGGIPIPSLAFTGDIFSWGEQHGTVLPGSATPIPGDVVLYGTGPASVDTSLHTGIVAQVWPDGAIVTIEGDAGPSNTGHLAVIVNGPYLPMDSDWYNGMGIYAFVQP